MTALDRDLVAAALPGHEVGEELGRGGWGIVLEGRHLQLGREVAIKQLPRAFACDPAVRDRFVAEARLLAGLDHPHIVPVYDFVEKDGLCLLVMEKLSGGTLWSRFTTTGLTMDLAVAVTLVTCAALKFAHSTGILHRDIKPENLMFSSSGVLKVTDFGIAKVLGGPATLATRAGEVLGTPAYMAPEQAQAKALTPATDIYATGVMAYELLSGRLPFEDDGDALALLYRHVYEQPLPLATTAPGVPGPVCDVIMKSLATNPADRYQAALDFGVELAEAATAAWGPGWLQRSDVPVMAAGPMVAVTERASAGPVGPMPMAKPKREKAPATEVETPVPAPESPGATARSSAPAYRPVASAAVHPSIAVHSRQAPMFEGDQADVAPLHEIVERPPPPIPRVLAAVAFSLVALMVAFLGLGSPSRTGTLAVSVNGADVGSGTTEIDLAQPVIVSGAAPGAAVSRVRLRLSVLGIPLASREGEAEPAPDGAFTATVDATTARYLVAGSATASVEVLEAEGQPATGSAESSRREFAIRTGQSPFLTAPGIGSVVLLLFVAAYAESLLRALRRGRKKVTGLAGMFVIGALAGVLMVLVAWILGGLEPAKTTVVICCLLGAGAGVASGLAAKRSCERRGFRVRRTPAP